MKTSSHLSIVLFAFLPIVPAFAGAAAPVTVTEAWIRALPSSVPSGGYFTLHNDGPAPLTLTGASSPGCGMLMLHKSENMSGMSKMEDVTGVDVPVGGTIKFAPGGYHLMCMDAKPVLKPGATIAVTLMFADHSSVQVPFGVRNAAGK